jgi:hypothetical protein
MRIEAVKILSDRTNSAVMRHPGRRFPGMLIPGDTLHALARTLASARAQAGSIDEEAAYELADVADALQDWLAHYERVLAEHGIELPYAK